MDRTILHCDNDAFYSTTEEMQNPNLRGKAHAVAGSVEDRNGIILAKSYVAKKYGVKTGEAIWQAKQKCPDLITMPPNYEMYLKYSKLASQIYSDYTDLIQPLGMDEAWLDLTGSTKLFGTGEEIARKLKDRVKYELGLTISVGVSFCMVFAKLGSDLNKPDGLCVITEENFREKLWPLPVSDLFGVGFRTDAVLQRYGIRTIGQLATTPQELLQRKFGVRGIDLWAYANGLDRSKVQHQEYELPIKSIGHGITTIQDLENTAESWNVILALTQAVGYKLRKHHKFAGGVAIHVRNNQLQWKQWQRKLPLATNSTSTIANALFQLFAENYKWEYPIRSLSVHAINLCSDTIPAQISFFSNPQQIEKEERKYVAVDTLNDRFGEGTIIPAKLLEQSKMPSPRKVEIRMPRGMI